MNRKIIFTFLFFFPIFVSASAVVPCWSTFSDQPFYYETFGDRSNPTLLLIHGMENDGRNWTQTVEALKDDYFIIVPDLPGLGKSAPFGSDYTPFQMAWILESLVFSTLKVEKLSVVGHSIGGRIAAQFAKNNADRISQLMVIDIPMSGNAKYAKRAGQYRSLVEGGDLGALPLLFFYDGLSQDLMDLVKDVKYPITFLAGDEALAHQKKGSTRLVTDEIRKLSELNEDIRIVMYPGCDHNVHENRTNEYIRELRALLNKESTAASHPIYRIGKWLRERILHQKFGPTSDGHADEKPTTP